MFNPTKQDAEWPYIMLSSMLRKKKKENKNQQRKTSWTVKYQSSSLWVVELGVIFVFFMLCCIFLIFYENY